MKKLFSLVAIVALMASCNNKKEEKKTDEVKTDTTGTTTTTTDDKMSDGTTTTATTGVPTFSDPEVQKFANDYAAFITAYKAGMNDPAKLQELSTKMTEWSTKGQSIGMKLANSPEEAKKWSDWWMAISKELMPANK
jgi:hypothetical protein